MAIKTGRDVCPSCEKYETYRLEGRGQKRQKHFVDCGLTIAALPMKLVKARQSAKTNPICFECGQTMTWVKRGRGGKWVCSRCGEG